MWIHSSGGKVIMVSYFELEQMLQEFIESKGFTLHNSIFTATGDRKTYRYTLKISRNDSLGETKNES